MIYNHKLKKRNEINVFSRSTGDNIMIKQNCNTEYVFIVTPVEEMEFADESLTAVLQLSRCYEANMMSRSALGKWITRRWEHNHVNTKHNKAVGELHGHTVYLNFTMYPQRQVH